MGNECTNSCTQSEEEKSEIPTSREKKYAFKRMVHIIWINLA